MLMKAGAVEDKPQIYATLSSIEYAVLPHVLYLLTLWLTIFIY